MCRKVGDKQVIILTGHRVHGRKATPKRKTRRFDKQILVLKEINFDEIPFTNPPPPEAPCEFPLDDVPEALDNDPMYTLEPSLALASREPPALQNQIDIPPSPDKYHEDHMPLPLLQQENTP